MLWARVMRGISSMANSVAPRSASSLTACGLPSGSTCRSRRGLVQQIEVRAARFGIGTERANLQHNVGSFEQLPAIGDDLRLRPRNRLRQ